MLPARLRAAFALGSAWLLEVALGVDPIVRDPVIPTGNGSKLLTYDMTTPYASYGPDSESYSWIDSGIDGEYVSLEDGAVYFKNIVTQTTRKIADQPDLGSESSGVAINVDGSKLVWAVNYTRQYRYSNFASYFVHDVKSGDVQPLVPEQESDVQYVKFNPVDPNKLFYVWRNNLYYWENGVATPITVDGGPDMFHGVPDWVYEEEIIENRFTTWWSPDGKYLTFLSFDETGVLTYTVPYYTSGNPNRVAVPQYPREKDIRYPKAGTKNPLVYASVVNLDRNSTGAGTTHFDVKRVDLETAFPADDLIIGEVAWMTDKHDYVIYRAFNRIQNLSKHLLYDVAAGTVKVVRDRDGTDGWIDDTKTMKFVGTVGGGAGNLSTTYTSNDKTYYLDLDDMSGWMHLYMFPVQGGTPKQLTSGEYEVRGMVAVDKAKGVVYFTSTERHPTDSHLYAINLATGKKTALVDDSVDGYWSASFTSQAGYYILNYGGPNVPFQQLYSANNTATPLRTITDNQEFIDLIDQYNLPSGQYMDLIHYSGHNISALVRLPANFDESKKYPLLLTPYGGPGSQEVEKRFLSLNWNSYLSSDPALEYITLTVDNRGTGYRGREFRNYLNRAMGTVEAKDQIWAAEMLADTYPWVDRSKVAIWGWSYGGYVSAKAVEENTGVITLGMITAPTVDCRLYDTMYTERYMGVPQVEEFAYERALVKDPAGFRTVAGGVLMQHGTGDDNVHFQHSAAMVNMLVQEHVPADKLQVQYFTDGDHSMLYGDQRTFLYQQLTMRLKQEKARVVPQEAAPEFNRRAVNAVNAKTAKTAKHMAKVGRMGVMTTNMLFGEVEEVGMKGKANPASNYWTM